jgi:hypothetical protein
LIVLAVVAVVVLLVNGCVIPWPGSAKSLYLDAASDGSGGAFAVWEDENVAYGQRIDFEGKLRWGDGVRLSTLQCWYPPYVTGDGSGGAIIVWSESEKRDVGYSTPVTYIQKVNPEGQVLWGQGGKPVAGIHRRSLAVPDGLGGAIVVQMWPQILLQRINSEGNPVWLEEGVTVCTTLSNTASDPSILTDGSGGATIAWADERAGGPRNDVYAQRVSPGGEIMWQEDGVPVSVPCYGQPILHIVSDGSDGAIVAWLYNKRDSGNFHVHAQRLSPDGEPLWQEGGVQVNALPAESYPLGMASDGTGGAIMAWHPSLSWGELTTEEGTLQGLRAQRSDSEGRLQWLEEAKLFVDVNVSGRIGSWGGMLGAPVVADGSGGAIIVGVFQSSGPLPRAQKLSPEGKPLWEVGGVQLFPEPRARSYGNLQVMSDGSGGVVIVAEAGRRFAYWNRIYAQRIDSQGNPLWTEGGVRVDPVSKISVLSPWVAVAAAVVVGAGVFVLRRRRA